MWITWEPVMTLEQIKKSLPWMSVVLLIIGATSAYAVTADQVGENKEDIKEIRKVQIKQAETDIKIEFMQTDLENLDDTMNDIKDDVRLILQQLRVPR